MQYWVIVVNPEEAFRLKGGFARLWRNRTWTSRLISVIWDEAHCIKSWASFCKDYGQAGRLRNVLTDVPYLIPSATLPEAMLDNVLATLHVKRARTVIHCRSNDRPNVYLAMRKMQHAVSSYKELDLLLPAGWKAGDRIPKFLVFFDSIEESMQAADMLRKRLPQEDHFKVLCFNSDMSASLHEAATAEYSTGRLWGLFCTDSFGMGVNISDIELVVQWRVNCDLNMLWQRLGRAAHSPGREAVAIILVEPKYFDEERQAAVQRAEKRAEKQRAALAKRVMATEHQKTVAAKHQKTVAAKHQKSAVQPPKRKRGDLDPDDMASDVGTAGNPHPAVKPRLDGPPCVVAEVSNAPRVIGENSAPQMEGENSPAAEGSMTAAEGGSGSQASVEHGSSSQAARAVLQLSEYEQLRVFFKTEAANAQSTKTKKVKVPVGGTELPAELDSLVNAATRAFKCYCFPINAFYENDKVVADKHQCLVL
ncbi:P-loop containing nucleoside triphosphate hydrolase protein [Cubamyces lactineus]|nr:P-loop containing nucleoside triphosphate hydrolase protein [Cubamyces lactineus]